MMSPWLLSLLLILLLPILLLGLWILSMRRNAPWQNVVAVSSNFKLKLGPRLRRFALSGQRDYSTLPDPLKMEDGTRITTAAAFEDRKKEILSLFETHVYGTMPRSGFTLDSQVVEEGEALEGKALRRQIRLTVTTPKGSSDALLLLYLPRAQGPVPAVLGLNFQGNPTVLGDSAILPSPAMNTADGKWEGKRGSCSGRWEIEAAIDRGYAVATLYSGDLAPDEKTAWSSRVVSLFDQPEFKVVGAWAFGLLRALDCLTGMPEIDSRRIVLVGHSRLGKAALWACANDPRPCMVISNDSGNSGASLSRGNQGESIATITRAFPHWFCSRYAAYAKKENTLPVDQNLLLAAIAPRKLYVANAQDDLWADPQGAYNALQSAKSAFRLYDDQVLPDGDSYPPVNTACFCRTMGIHLRTGWHDITPRDWGFYLDYLDQYIKGQEIGYGFQ